MQVNTQDFGIFVFEENEDDISRHSIEDIKRESKYSDIGKLELWHFRYSIYSNHKNLDGLVLEITPLNFKEVVKCEYDIVDTQSSESDKDKSLEGRLWFGVIFDKDFNQNPKEFVKRIQNAFLDLRKLQIKILYVRMKL